LEKEGERRKNKKIIGRRKEKIKREKGAKKLRRKQGRKFNSVRKEGN
jgi:hypothetical protein